MSVYDIHVFICQINTNKKDQGYIIYLPLLYTENSIE